MSEWVKENGRGCADCPSPAAWCRACAAEADRDRFKRDHLSACELIAEMHGAAVGEFGDAPKRGVLEDVQDLRADRDRLAIERNACAAEMDRQTAISRSLSSEVTRLRGALVEACDLGKSIAWKLHRECPNDMDETEHPTWIKRFNTLATTLRAEGKGE